jgi:hypothetical protein
VSGKTSRYKIAVNRISRRAAVVEDLESALAMLHGQFNVPHPDSLQEISIGPVPIVPSVSSGSIVGVSLELPYAELAYLLNEMLAAGCVEWALLIATVLMNVNQIVIIIKENTSLWKNYSAALSKQER